MSARNRKKFIKLQGKGFQATAGTVTYDFDIRGFIDQYVIIGITVSTWRSGGGYGYPILAVEYDADTSGAEVWHDWTNGSNNHGFAAFKGEYGIDFSKLRVQFVTLDANVQWWVHLMLRRINN